MPRNGAGTASLASAPFVFDTVISETPMNANFSDIINMITASIANDGQTPILANLPMSGYKHTGVTATSGASSRTEYSSTGTLQDGVPLNGGTTGGTSTAYTATLTPSPGAYAAGQRFRVKFNAACGDNPTIDFNTIGAKKLYKEVTGSFVQFSSGGIPADFDGDLVYDTALDSAAGGFVVLNAPLYAQGADVASDATINLDTATGDVVDVTGTTTITAITLKQGQARTVRFTGALTLTNGASLVLPGGANITTAAGDFAIFRGYASSVVRCVFYSKASGQSIVGASIPVRQCVISGPLDSNGLAAFGGSTGSTTVTMSGTLIATAANGFSVGGSVDTVGTGTNLSWTGLSTNGQMYLYATISGGVLTAASTTLRPVYQWGGTPSTTSGQLTFNIAEMKGYLGNGSAAVQTNWVGIGQVTVTANVVSAIRWYAIQGIYVGPFTATLPNAGTTTTENVNMGHLFYDVSYEIRNNSTELGFAVGDILQGNLVGLAGAINVIQYFKDSGGLLAGFTVPNTRWQTISSTGSDAASIDRTKWDYRIIAKRTF